MDYTKFWKQVKYFEGVGMRRGQAMYNVAYEWNSELCEKAVEMVGDPFYHDENATLFYVEFSRMYDLQASWGLEK